MRKKIFAFLMISLMITLFCVSVFAESETINKYSTWFRNPENGASTRFTGLTSWSVSRDSLQNITGYNAYANCYSYYGQVVDSLSVYLRAHFFDANSQFLSEAPIQYLANTNVGNLSVRMSGSPPAGTRYIVFQFGYSASWTSKIPGANWNVPQLFDGPNPWYNTTSDTW